MTGGERDPGGRHSGTVLATDLQSRERRAQPWPVHTDQLRSESFAVNERQQEGEDIKEFYADKVAVVTGGASGIGLAMAELLLQFGAVVIIADINETKLNTKVARLAEQHMGKIFGKKTDISKADEVEALVDYAVEKGGRLDFMFNNAGLGLAKPIDEITMDDWKFAFDVNFYGALYAPWRRGG